MNVTQYLRELGKKGRTSLVTASLASLAFVPLAAAQNVIEEVSVAKGAAGRTTMTFTLKEPLAGSPAVFAIATPPRLVLDFANTTTIGKATNEVTDSVLRSYNVVQAQGRTRVVLNLSKSQAYEVKSDNKKLVVALFDAPGTTVGESAPEAGRFSAAVKTDSASFGLRDVDFRRGQGGEGRIIVDLSAANSGVDIKAQGKVLIVDFLRTQVPRNLERKLDVSDFGTPVQQIDTFAQGSNTRMVIEPKGLWEHSAYQTDNRLIIEVKPIVEDPNKLTQGSRPGYKGEKLSLNFQDIAVRSVLQVIGDFTGLNIIVSDTVTGNVTLRLKDVPWDQALDLVMQARSLDMRKNGNVVWIAPKEELALKEKQELEAKAQVADIEPLRTEMFQLNYQKAEEFRKILVPTTSGTGVGATTTGVLSKRGSATADSRTNVLIVQDTPSKLEQVRTLLQKIDVAVRQVIIEARIVIAEDTFSRQLGARFGIGAGITSNGRNIGISGSPAPLSGNLPSTGIATGSPPTSYYWGAPGGTSGGVSTGNPVPYNVNLPVANPFGSLAMTILNLRNGNLVNLELSAAEAAGRSKVISSPRLVTMSNQKATIEQGVEIPYITPASGTSTTPAIAFKKAVLSLSVTPQITPDNRLLLDVLVTKDSIASRVSGTDIPIINKREITTKVAVGNGETVVLGGIYEEFTSDDVDKVPFLGDAPFVGALFRKTGKRTEKTEMLIFLTPRILSDDTGTLK